MLYIVESEKTDQNLIILKSQDDLKPPILRRLEAKPQKSEHFYNSDNRSNKYITKNVSKSCNDIDNEKKPPLVDSLKIFRNIKPMSPSSRVFNNFILIC